MTVRRQWYWLWIVCFILGACDEGDPTSANPQPVPVPDLLPVPSAEQIFLSGSYKGGVLVAGLTGSTQVGDAIVVKNSARNIERQRSLCADKSFLLEIDWTTGESLSCQARNGEQSSQAIRLLLPTSGTTAPDPPQVETVVSLTSDETRVTGQATPSLLVIIGNQSTGCALSITTSMTGTYAVSIPASPGDTLVLFSVVPTTRTSSEVVEAVVR